MRTPSLRNITAPAALGALGVALACSAGATRYADEEREGTAGSRPLAEFGAGALPGNPGMTTDPAAPGGPSGPAVVGDEGGTPGEGAPPSLPLAPVDGVDAPPGDGPAEGIPEASSEAEPTTEVASAGGCELSVSVTTVSPGGRYAPRNVGAIWIADTDERFVKSLNVWGDRRLRHVEAWNAATEAAGVAGNVVDAVTGATAPSHAPRLGSWDCRDSGGQLVADGRYRVYFEVTESNGAGPTTFANFTKGPEAESVQTAAPSFDNITLTFTP